MSLPTPQEETRLAEEVTLRVTGKHSPAWMECGVRWARDRWMLDDSGAVWTYIESWDGEDPTEAVDSMAAHYDLEDPSENWGPLRELPIRAEYQP